jgi:polysaccharide transporter, PST family
MAQKFLSRVLKHPVAQNALSLFTVQVARYILPIITIPYLARILGPEALGLVVFTQVSAQWFEMLLDYGFNLSATREVARQQDSQEQIAEIVSNVIGASGLLLLGSALVVTLMRLTIPVFARHPDYLAWAWLIGIFQGLSPLWYFQGVERMQITAVLDLSIRLIATVTTFLWIKMFDEGWKVLFLQAISGIFAYAVMLILIYREIPWIMPSLGSALKTLRRGVSLFIFRGSVSLYTIANTFILGLILPYAEVAFFGETQRISKAVGGLLVPISQAMFPRTSYLLANDSQRAAKLTSISAIVMGIGSLGLAIILAIFSPYFINIILGSKFEAAIPLLRVLAFIIPFMILNYVLGIQWMIPLGLERQCNTIMIIAGLVNLSLGLSLTHKFGTIGMAWSVVMSEMFIAVSMYCVLCFKGLSFHQIIRKSTTDINLR